MASCRNAGLDLAVVTKALSEGGTGSAHIKLHAGLMAAGQYPEIAPFTPAGRIKDLEYAIALMRQSGVEPVVADAARATFAAVAPELRASINDTQVVDYVGKPRPPNAPD
jgi:3-hydroxyisobutyrate dehydrogenase-like beta-hydroxyacid dehydrogenase